MPSDKKTLPLSALLSQALIAFTLDFDAAINKGRRAAALCDPVPTLAMWANVLRFVGEQGVDERRLPELSGISRPVVHSFVACLERHGWVTVRPARVDKHAKIIQMTARCAKYAASWRAVVDRIEARWRKRFGAATIDALRGALESISTESEEALPHYPMPQAQRGATPTGL